MNNTFNFFTRLNLTELLGKKAQENLFFDEKAAKINAPARTLSDLSKNASRRGLDVGASLNEKGSTNIIVSDKSRINKDVTIAE